MTNPSLQSAVAAEILRLRPSARVEVAVSGDVLTLTGEVDSESDRTVIEQELLAWPSVSDIHNQLHVRPPPGEPAAQLRALMVQDGASPDGIDIVAADGVITLSGQARTWFDRDAAERLAWSLPGVRSVVNAATIPPGAVDPTDDEGGQIVI